MRPVEGIWAGAILTPTPTPSVTPTLSFTPTITQTSGASPTPTFTPTPTHSLTPTPSPTPVFQWINETYPNEDFFPQYAFSDVFAVGNSSNYLLTDGPAEATVTSTDGVNFTAQTGGLGIGFDLVAYNGFTLNNSRYIMFCDNEQHGTFEIYYTTSSNPIGGYTKATINGNTANNFFAGQVATDGTNIIVTTGREGGAEGYNYLYSTDQGVTWHVAPGATSMEQTVSVAYGLVGGNNMWIITDEDDIWYINANIHSPFTTSISSWTNIPSSSLGGYFPSHLAFGNSTFVGVGGKSAEDFGYLRSTDGVTWTTGVISGPGLTPGNGFTCFIYDPFSTNFIAGLSNNANTMYHSGNGSTWFTKSSPNVIILALTAGLNGPLAYGNVSSSNLIRAVQRYGF